MNPGALLLVGALGAAVFQPGQADMIVPEVSPTGAFMIARGTFEVRLNPQPSDSSGGPFARLSLEKEFQGDLTGTSKGQMLGAETGTEGSAGYVALELVTGTLHGRRGSFVLQHAGRMSRGAMTLTITVVPDSGTEELAGLAGRFDITITDGKHYYAFEYSLGS